MNESLPDAARAVWREYEQLLSRPVVPQIAAGVRERKLAEMVPGLLDEISRRDMLLTRVRSLTGTECGLYDLPDDYTVPVYVIRAALDGEGAAGGA